MKVHDWLQREGDLIMYRLGEQACENFRAACWSEEPLITEFQLKAAAAGLNKRQREALKRAVRLLAAYVRTAIAENDIKSAEVLMGTVMRWRVDQGIITHRQALKRLNDLAKTVGEKKC